MDFSSDDEFIRYLKGDIEADECLYLTRVNQSLKYFDKQGRPMSRIEWAVCFADLGYRGIALTKIPRSQKIVSTVWLGLDHAMPPTEPLIFETMLFNGGHGEGCWRWASEAEALAGHYAVVDHYRYSYRQRRRYARTAEVDPERRRLIATRRRR